uniref:ribonuclease H n=1 Tax=Podarcis muralis TaxID=64176 RepID=A0A670I2D7_PODMU
MDTTSNRAGKHLCELIIKHNLLLCNGHGQGDQEGYFTFTSPRGFTSTIDYILTSNNVPVNRDTFRIIPRAESDHFPLELSLTLFFSPAFPKLLDETEYLILGNRRLKWNAQVQEKMIQILDSHEFALLKGKMLLETGNVIGLYENIINQMRPLMTTASVIKNKKFKRQTWFDKECQNSKKYLARVLRKLKLKQDKHNLALQAEVAQLRNNYKLLLKSKKQIYYEQQWKELGDAALQKDSRKFWHLVAQGTNALGYSLEASVQGKDWVTYFTEIYGPCPDLSPQVYYTQLSELPEWPDVTPNQIKRLIASQLANKAPGEDMIPMEIYKIRPDFWSPIFAKLFSYINSSGRIPEGWKLSIIAPIYKKGDKKNPANYRPISLLDVASKLYARLLLGRLEEWADTNKVISEVQAGFQRGKSTLDQCFVLNFLLCKYIHNLKQKLYVAFIDLKSAFDTVPRHALWQKLEKTNIDLRLLFLIKTLYTDTSIQVKVDLAGHLTTRIKTTTGVKQGCILAPFLFNFYINDMVKELEGLQFAPVTILDQKLSVLMYADDLVLVSRTQVGLRRLLAKLSSYCMRNALSINYDKTQVIVFGKRSKKHVWHLDEHIINQVNTFKYLGLIYSETASWNTQLSNIKLQAFKSAKAILKFAACKGGNLVNPALSVYKAKTMAQILYGAEVWGTSKVSGLEPPQNYFLRVLLGLPKDVQSAMVRLETHMLSIESQIDKRILCYWFRVQQMDNTRLPKKCLIELSNGLPLKNWVHHAAQLMGKYDLSVTEIKELPLYSQKNIFKRTIRAVATKNDLNSMCTSTCAPLYFKLREVNEHISYFNELTFAQLRKAFTELRLNTISSAYRDGRHRGIPKNERVCIRGCSEVEDLMHYILHCPLYNDARKRFLVPIMTGSPGQNPLDMMLYLLADTDKYVTWRVALFATAARKIRANYIAKVAINCKGDEFI